MNRFSLLIWVLLSALLLPAQNMTMDDIKRSNDFLWGEGFGETFREADNLALQQLVGKISLSVESSFTNVEREVSTNGDIDANTAIQSVMKTYSQATLTNTQQLVVSQEPDAHVFRYVHKSDVHRIFEARRNKVYDFVGLAGKAEEKLKIDDVLRYYYWAYCMLTSLPDTMQPKSPENGILLRTWIPDKINEVFGRLKLTKQNVDGEFVTLKVTYDGRPVASLDYTYFDGQGYTNIYSATDGIGVMEMQPGVSTDNLKVKCEYEYLGEAQIDKEIALVVGVMKGCNFRNAYISVGGDMAATLPRLVNDPSLIPQKSVTEMTMVSSSEATDYETIMKKVLAAVRSKDFASVEHYFTPEGQKMFNGLLHYGNARIIEEPQLAYINKGNEVICRSVPMCFSFKNNTRKFVENVCFTFNADRKINCVAFGLGEEAAGDILKRADYSEQARIVLTQFLENYKTAFALKRLDYIESIFDDNALIITGTVVKRTNYQNKEEQTRFLDNQIIKYNRYKKNEYIKHLERCFNSNEFVNIRFANNDVVKAGGDYGEVYGIQIKQDYYSTNYGDTGYLFLYVDLNDPDNPVIKVRTWQPERDPDFGLYGLGDF